MAAIDDLRERVRAMERRQSEWNVTFEQAYSRLRRERCGRWRRPAIAQEEELRDEARRAAGEDFTLELFAFVDELADAYLAEKLPQNRAKLRADVGHSPGLLAAVWAYAVQALDLLRDADDSLRLERALAVLSIDDLRTDVEQVDALLARLWLAALRVGIDARAAFERVAAVSNPGMGGGGACLAPRLATFEASLAYKRIVAPELHRLSA